jgi:LysM repeat protein
VTRKQMAFLIGVNAVVSTLITLLLVLVILPAAGVREVTVAPAATTAPAGQQATPAEAGPVPSATPVIHTVQAGDSISALAMEYGLPQEDIIAANQLENPNLLQVGSKLLIPVGGLPPASPTWTAVPTASDTPLPFEPPSAEMTAEALDAESTQVAAQEGATASSSSSMSTTIPAAGELQIEITEVIGPGQADEERVVITNLGERLADMQGWTLTDGEGNTYTFPNFRLWRGGNVTVHTHIGQDGNPPNNFYWNKLVAVWSLGEVVTLKDAAGDVISTYSVGP